MTLVLGYDDSDASQHALDVALDLAAALHEPLVIVYGVAPPGRRGEEYRELERAIEELGTTITAVALERATAAGVSAEVALVPERPSLALLSVAEEREARLVVVGTHGESTLKSALIGSTTYRLLHRSRRPVLVVPLPDGV